MHLTRRECLRAGLGSSAVLACGHAIPAFLARSALALAGEGRLPPERVLVVVELDGGNDGLNTVVPYGDDVYYRSRPRLGIPEQSVLRIDDHVGFHPQLRPFVELMADGQLAVVQSVGYPNPSRSHFRSMAIWHAGRLDATLAEPGWLSRYIDAQTRIGTSDASAIQVDEGKIAQALTGAKRQVPTLSRLERIERRLGVPAAAGPEEQRARLDFVLGQQRGLPGSHLQFVQQNTLVSFASSRRLAGVIRAAKGSAEPYPEFGLAQRLKVVAQLIKARLGTVVYYTRLGGFDTHVRQSVQHQNLLRELGSAVQAFFADLTRSNEAERVLMLVFSEFGRRLEENGGAGTDHGTAGPVFLLGPPACAGVHGPYPNLVDLENGDPKHAVDFRRVYATVLEEWLCCSAERVLGGAFEPLPCLASDVCRG